MLLKIDIDSRDRLTVGQLVSRLARAQRRLVWLEEHRSPSGRGWHQRLTVTPKPKTALEVVALQLLCGSDPKREGYNINRALAVDAGRVSPFWRRRWNVLYRRGENVARTVG